MKRSGLIALAVALALVLAVLLALVIVLRGNQEQAVPAYSATDVATQTSTETVPTVVPETQPQTAAPTQPQTTQPPTPQVSPDVVGLYIPAADGTKARELVSVFTGKRTAKTDIDCFEVLAADVERVEGTSFTGIWKSAWNSFEDTDGAKIGFHISFDLENGETVQQTILKPSDSQGFYNYLEIYLYDDINQTPGVWYTHLEDDDMQENTVISSIKLTSGSDIAQVGDIRLSAFVYNDPACFDGQGQYIADVIYTIVITE